MPPFNYHISITSSLVRPVLIPEERFVSVLIPKNSSLFNYKNVLCKRIIYMIHLNIHVIYDTMHFVTKIEDSSDTTLMSKAKRISFRCEQCFYNQTGFDQLNQGAN